MADVEDNSIQLILTSPPYFNIKDYSLDGYQRSRISDSVSGQIGSIPEYDRYIGEMLEVWRECERVLSPNGKLAINAPLMPMPKKEVNTHHNRHIYDISGDIRTSITSQTKLFLLDVYIWNRTNPSKKLMFGSYPYPRNFYAQNTIEFVSVFVKAGEPDSDIPPLLKEKSKLSEKEWLEFTNQVWNIPIPAKNDLAFGKHPAIMPEELAKRCILLYTFAGDIVLDPFTGSGTTLRVAHNLGRRYVGYEINKDYSNLISMKLADLF